MAEAKSQYLAVMFVDIADAPEQRGVSDMAHTRALVERCVTLLSVVRKRHNGKLIRTVGSTLLCSFGGVDDAVAAACAMQETVENTTFDNGMRPALRIAMHAGDAVVHRGVCTGDVVTTAARLVSVVEPRQVVVTGAVVQALSSAASRSVRRLARMETMEERLKVELHEVPWQGEPAAEAAAPAAAEEEAVAVAPKSSGSAAKTQPGMVAPSIGVTPSGRIEPIELAPGPSSADSGATAVLADPAPAVTLRLEKGSAVNVAPRAATALPAGTTYRPGHTKALRAAAAGIKSQLCLVWQGDVLVVDAERPLMRMGRDDHNDVVLSSDMASRSHVEVELRPDGYFVIDHSMNGTFVYNQAGEEVLVNNAEVPLDVAGAICPGCPQDAVGCEALLFWVTEGEGG